MRTVVLAGGMGTRFAEETDLRPKPMIEIGGRPLLWHIMKRYELYGHGEFVIALGYKGDAIKAYYPPAQDVVAPGDVALVLVARDEDAHPHRVAIRPRSHGASTTAGRRDVRCCRAGHLQAPAQLRPAGHRPADEVGDDVDRRGVHRGTGREREQPAGQPLGLR